jgi:general L-amino acid transport system permease protein
MHPSPLPAFWRDRRFRQLVGQAIVFLLIALAFGLLGTNLIQNLRQIGIQLGFDFLRSQAGFSIGDHIVPYQPADNYGQALFVGLVNSLCVIATGIGLATLVGVTVGLARLSTNGLAKLLALIYVETLRNTPLLLHLFFWYFVVFFSLPPTDTPITWLGLVAFSKSGISCGGLALSSEFSAITLGLSFYTATFIAEIVRSGVQSVPKGQWEAAQAIGLQPAQMMRLVIFPQALRAIVPSLANQYLNLAKNSSLAIAVGYPDLYAVSSTTFNQTGRAVEVMLLICVTYLLISLFISLLMNVYNRTVQVIER